MQFAGRCIGRLEQLNLLSSRSWPCNFQSLCSSFPRSSPVNNCIASSSRFSCCIIERRASVLQTPVYRLARSVSSVPSNSIPYNSTSEENEESQDVNDEDLDGVNDDNNIFDDLYDSIYDHAELYEQAFSFRNIPEEVEFIKRAFHEHAGRKLKSCLELGCGPAAHSRLLSSEGVDCIALDSSAAMVQYAQEKAKKDGVQLQLIEENMEDYELPDGVTVDLALCLLGSFSHMLATEAALATFRNAHRSLSPGGIFLVEMEHPEHIFSGVLLDAYGEEGKVETWDREVGNGEQVCVRYGEITDTFDAVSQVLIRTIRIERMKAEEVKESCEEAVPQKVFTYTEMDLLAQVTGFEIVGTYGEMKWGVGLENDDDAYRMVLAMKKLGK